ncbi:MAG: DUF1707 domain-containing protein [Pseudonocardiales bacterium]|nr:DUF1707 domain-containing protein [Pseudonocardiales bacterium]
MAGEIERADMRASDGDRSAVARRLQHAVDEGRLDLGDYDERLQQTYAAKTYGELDRITADLPAPVPEASPARSGGKDVARRKERGDEWRSWAGTSLVLITIWGITSVAAGTAIFFWPIFPVGIWAAILVASMLERRSKDT